MPNEPGWYVQQGGYGSPVGTLARGRLTDGPFLTACEPAAIIDGLKKVSVWAATARVTKKGKIKRVVLTHFDHQGITRTEIIDPKELRDWQFSHGSH